MADDLVRDAVEQIDGAQELRAARALVRRRLPGTADDDPTRRIRRLARMLARKGYDSGVALRAIREELADEGQDLDPAELCRAPFTSEFDLP
ncbi:MAG: regulatory protein [Actinomycetota bacterium]|nr:regulatory protein [Actinomycetota bacterium]